MLVAAFFIFCPMIVRNVLPGAILSLPEFITYFITYVNIHQKKKDGNFIKSELSSKIQSIFSTPFHKWLISFKNGWYASKLDDH
jgi:hypothetical protein